MSVHSAWAKAFSADPDGMKAAWLSFMGRNLRFPREIMVPSVWVQGGRKRWTVPNSVDLVESIQQHAPRGDVWVSTRSTTQFYEAEPTHSRLWIDVDAKGDLELARLRAEAVSMWCRDVLGALPYVQFSASKGYHLHLDHAPVLATSDQLRSAVKLLLRDAGLEPEKDVDLNVIGNTRAMARPPYTANTNAVGLYGEVLFTIPVDLDWTIGEVLERSRQVLLGDVMIPYSTTARHVLQDVVAELPVSEKRAIASDKSISKLCRETIAFLDRVAPHVKDGRKRFLRHLVIPAYLHMVGESEVMEACRRFIEAGGGSWSYYRTYAENQVRAAHLHNGDLLYPMKIRRFIVQNPDLLPIPEKR